MKPFLKIIAICITLTILAIGCKPKHENAMEVSEYERLYNRLISINVITAGPDSTLMILKLSESLKNSGIEKYECAYYNIKGSYYWSQNKLDSAIYCYKMYANHPATEENIKDVIDACNGIGIISIMKGELDSASHYLNRELEFHTQNNNEKGIASVNYYLSALLIEKGQYSKALEHQLLSIKHAENINDTVKLIDNYNSLGVIFYRQKMQREATNAYLRAANLCMASNKFSSFATICNNLYTIYDVQRKPDSASYYLTLALNKVDKKNARTYGTLLLNKGILFIGTKQTDSANYYIQKMLRVPHAKEVVNNFALNKNIGLIKLYKKEYDSAYYYLDLALKYALEKKNIDRIAESYKIISLIDSAKMNYKNAYQNFKTHKIYYDSVFNKENQKRIDILNMEYEVEKKDFQLRELDLKDKLTAKTIRNQNITIVLASLLIIALLLMVALNKKANKKIEIKNKQILKQNDKLTELVNTKDKFFSIISHDLRGPFHSLIASLNMLIDEYEHLSKEEKFEIIKSSRNTSQNSFDLLNMLLEWSRTQRGAIECSTLDMICSDTIRKAIDLATARSNEKKQTIINNVPENTAIYADDKLLTTIINNLINNAIKFTQVGGTIIIDAQDGADEVVFSVADNGIGIPQEKASRIFRIDSDYKRKGTANEPGTGLGLVIVKEFVTLLKGKIWVKSDEGKGSTFYFSVPKYQK